MTAAVPAGRPKRVAAQTGVRLNWSCRVCGKSIADRDGYVTLDLGALRQYQADNAAWEREIRASNHGQLVIHGEPAWMSMPEPPQWEVLHRACDPEPNSVDYWISVERIRTPVAVMEWTAHLLEKRWFPATNWGDLLRQRVIPQLSSPPGNRERRVS